MKKLVRFCTLTALMTIFTVPTILAQNDQTSSPLPEPFKVLYDARAKGNISYYFAAGLELQKLEKEFLDSEKKSGYLQIIGTYSATMGEYQQAISYFDQIRIPNKPQTSPNNSNSVLDNYQPHNAVKVIESMADSHRVIFINEAHHVPLHRAFTLELLPILYRKGYRYFAAETLSIVDKELAERRYPMYAKTGILTDEPVYGDLIRTALKLGFTVVPYEQSDPCTPQEKDPDYCQKVRERGQAQNLYDRILAKDPSAKILVHAGYAHIKKDQFSRNVPSMAKCFQEITGITPFSIDQIEMMEHSSTDYEKLIYQSALGKGLVKEPTIFQSSDGSFFVEERYRKSYDAQIFHPRSIYQSGRPTWLLMHGTRKPYKFSKDLCKNTFPCLVQAFLSSEDTKAVPVDQIKVSQAKDLPALILPPGKFRIQAIDQTGKLLGEKQISIKK